MENMLPTGPLAPYYYYGPDRHGEKRSHGHFTSHPAFQPQLPPQMPIFPMVPTLPSTPMYSRPGSSCSQVPMQGKPCTSVPTTTLTPMASPQPTHQHSVVILDPALGDEFGNYAPATPPRSSTSSSISSPSCDMLQTPLNPMLSGLEIVEGKTGEVERHVENFSVLSWSNCASPPMTPMYLPQAAKSVSLQHVNGFLSCSSLSPSPASYARSVSSEDIDFCDPRNLTVGTTNPTLAPDFSGLPSLCPGDEEDNLAFRGQQLIESLETAPLSDFQGLGPFDDLSDLESEDNFVNGLVHMGDSSAYIRSRSCSDTPSLMQSTFSSEDDCSDFEDLRLPSSVTACEDGEQQRNKRQKVSKPAMNTAADLAPHRAQAEGQQEVPTRGEPQSSQAMDENADRFTSGSEKGGNHPIPTNRRGRKQSLTEDPSKTFICDLCNRRFRRQEHLKRHYRSLHTHEKPFECHECGKKFSRSDNLAQHARTHGAGAIVMNLMEDPEATGVGMHAGYGHAMMGAYPVVTHDDPNHLGRVLFQVASEVAGSSSDTSSDEAVDGRKKKRKSAS